MISLDIINHILEVIQNVIDDVKAYQIQNPHRLKLADMTEVEKELLRKEMLEKGLLG